MFNFNDELTILSIKCSSAHNVKKSFSCPIATMRDSLMYVSVCVCVSVSEIERERESVCVCLDN